MRRSSVGVGAVQTDPKGCVCSFFSEKVPDDWMGLFLQESNHPVFELELLPVLVALCVWEEEFKHSEAARVAFIHGSTPSLTGSWFAKNFISKEMQRQLKVWFARVPTSTTVADRPSRLDVSELTAKGVSRVTVNGRPFWSNFRNTDLKIELKDERDRTFPHCSVEKNASQCDQSQCMFESADVIFVLKDFWSTRKFWNPNQFPKKRLEGESRPTYEEHIDIYTWYKYIHMVYIYANTIQRRFINNPIRDKVTGYKVETSSTTGLLEKQIQKAYFDLSGRDSNSISSQTSWTSFWPSLHQSTVETEENSRTSNAGRAWHRCKAERWRCECL